MEVNKSDIVRSLAGRDKDEYFFVVGLEGEYVLLADGKRRKLEKPKRKKRMHVCQAARTASRVAEKLSTGDKVLNSELRRELADFRQKFLCQNQGG